MGLLKVSEETRNKIANLNLMSDVLFHKVMEDRAACETMLRIILNDEHIKIVESD